jgi:hypothetical protein
VWRIANACLIRSATHVNRGGEADSGNKEPGRDRRGHKLLCRMGMGCMVPPAQNPIKTPVEDILSSRPFPQTLVPQTQSTPDVLHPFPGSFGKEVARFLVGGQHLASPG